MDQLKPAMVATEQGVVFKGRWGFYPCTYEEYLERKKLHKYLYAARRQYGVWRRWNRKDIQNRVYRKTLRNGAGQKIGSEITGFRPEPSVNQVFVNSGGVLNKTLADLIYADYRAARFPSILSTGVPKLQLSIGEVRKLLELCEGIKGMEGEGLRNV